MKTSTAKKIPGRSFKRAWPPCGAEAREERRPTLIKMVESVKAKINSLFGNAVFGNAGDKPLKKA